MKIKSKRFDWNSEDVLELEDNAYKPMKYPDHVIPSKIEAVRYLLYIRKQYKNQTKYVAEAIIDQV